MILLVFTLLFLNSKNVLYLQAFLNDRIGRIDEDTYSVSVEEVMGEVLTSNTAHVSPIYAIYPRLLSQNYSDLLLCELSKVPLDGPPAKSSMFINKTSPLKEVFNYQY